MTIFAVEYTYAVSPEQLAEVRPAHREFLGKLYEEGVVLASGPIGDFVGALIVMQGSSIDSIAALLEADPFDIAGFISERTIREWTPVFGPFETAHP